MAAVEGIVERAELRNRVRVFRDRGHAGELLAELLADRLGDWLGDWLGENALVFAVPAGGVPVAANLAERLDLELEVAVVSKMTLPWNTEVGFGALAFDGTVRVNEALVRRAALDEATVAACIERTREKVARRVARLRGDRPWPALAGRTTILVDDGIASGFTLRVAVAALRGVGAGSVWVAVPTAHARSAAELAREVEALYCANVREGLGFAVADAYREWRDLGDDEVERLLEAFRERARPPR